MPTDITTTQTRLYRLLEKAAPKNSKRQSNTSKHLPPMMIICLLGTMLPFQTTMAFFSLSFVTIALLSLILYWLNHLKTTKGMVVLLTGLTVTSILSGCSPAFTFQTPPELIKFAHANDFDVHSIRRIGIFGLGLDDATIATAQAESNIKTVQGAQIDRGHGLVNIINVMIAGKS